MNPEPLPGHELLTEPFLRQWGAVEGMKLEHCGSWVNSVLRPGDRCGDYGFNYIAPLGTRALVSTPLPEVRCECSLAHNRNIEIEHRHLQQHAQNCPCHHNNRLVKVLPGRLARLKVKPEGLHYASAIMDWRWTLDDEDWEKLKEFQLTSDYAYALPARVLAAIETVQKVQKEITESEGPELIPMHEELRRIAIANAMKERK